MANAPAARPGMIALLARTLALGVAALSVVEGCRRDGREGGDAGTTTITSGPVPGDRSGADGGLEREQVGGVVSAAAFGFVAEDAAGGGARIVRVTPGSQAGALLRPGDVVTAVDEAPVQDAEDLGRYQRALRREGGGRIVLFHVRAPDESTRFVAFTLP